MIGLRLFFFAEFAALALAVPALTTLRRRIGGKTVTAVAIPVLATVPLMALAHNWLPSQSFEKLFELQALALSFGLAIGGMAALLSRAWQFGGPMLVTLLALLLLATPFWGDALLGIDNDFLRTYSVSFLVAPNPLFTVPDHFGFDWTQADILYGLTRIDEDFAASPVVTDWRVLTAWFGGLGLLTMALAAMIRQYGRKAEYVVEPSDR